MSDYLNYCIEEDDNEMWFKAKVINHDNNSYTIYLKSYKDDFGDTLKAVDFLMEIANYLYNHHYPIFINKEITWFIDEENEHLKEILFDWNAEQEKFLNPRLK